MLNAFTVNQLLFIYGCSSGTSTELNAGSGNMLQLLQLSEQLKELTNKVSRIECLLDSFASCKACIKKACRACVPSTAASRSPVQGRNFPSKSMLTEKESGPSCPAEPSKPTMAPRNGDGSESISQSGDDNIMLGNPQHGIYVSKAKLEKLPKEKAKNYALKLFVLLFSREEARTSSIEGKGTQLKKLDLNRIEALKESTKKQFPSENIKWSEIESSINCKCRMVRNGRCLTWA